jgi:hypothetical protein
LAAAEADMKGWCCWDFTAQMQIAYLLLLPAACTCRGRYMTAYFACANKTGQHFLLKKYDKRKCYLQWLVHWLELAQQSTLSHSYHAQLCTAPLLVIMTAESAMWQHILCASSDACRLCCVAHHVLML